MKYPMSWRYLKLIIFIKEAISVFFMMAKEISVLARAVGIPILGPETTKDIFKS